MSPATTDAQEGPAGMPYIDSSAGTTEPRHTDARPALDRLAALDADDYDRTWPTPDAQEGEA